MGQSVLMSWFIFVLGAVTGSFLNVCIYRMPRELSIVRPRSFCPACRAMIPWYRNIPLLSYWLLGGRCAVCKKKISVRYFLVELMSALLWLFLWREAGFSLEFTAGIIFSSTLLVVIMTDFETGLIPDQFMFFGMAAGLLLSLVGYGYFTQPFWHQRLLGSLLGLLAGGGILFVTGWLGTLVFRKESMGGGDIKFLAMMGSFLGVTNVLLVFLLAPFPALPFALWQRFVKKEETIPYGPFLALAGAVIFFHRGCVINFLSNNAFFKFV